MTTKKLRTAAGRELMARKTSGLLVDVVERIEKDAREQGFKAGIKAGWDNAVAEITEQVEDAA